MTVLALQGALAHLRPWSRTEDKILRATYERHGHRRACELLPGRSVQAVFHRARVIGLSTHRRWTRSDDAQLRDLWESGLGLPAIAKRLLRSAITTYWRAQKIGLPLGCPAGWEYISIAAERTGYERSQLRRILEWAGFSERRAVTRPIKGASYHRRIVVPEEVDEAVARWHETEPLYTAAKRVGVCSETLRRRLAAIGIVDQGRAFRVHWRVSTADVERAMSRWHR